MQGSSEKLAIFFFCFFRIFIYFLCELNFGTVVISQLLLQHAHLTIVGASPCVVDVPIATGCVVKLGFQRVLLLQRGRICTNRQK